MDALNIFTNGEVGLVDFFLQLSAVVLATYFVIAISALTILTRLTSWCGWLFLANRYWAMMRMLRDLFLAAVAIPALVGAAKYNWSIILTGIVVLAAVHYDLLLKAGRRAVTPLSVVNDVPVVISLRQSFGRTLQESDDLRRRAVKRLRRGWAA